MSAGATAAERTFLAADDSKGRSAPGSWQNDNSKKRRALKAWRPPVTGELITATGAARSHHEKKRHDDQEVACRR
jgi:hypothetical protein